MARPATRVVYTILLGGYEELLHQPVLRDSGIDRVCFTDSADLLSEDWTVVRVEPRYPADIVRSQREIKTRVTRYLGQYSESLYIDNTVRLRALPEEIIENWLGAADVALAKHSFRDRLIDEFDEVVRLNYDDAVRVHEQLWDYGLTFPEILESQPLWTGMIARRHTQAVSDAMEIWMEHVLRYSRRDQLSVAYALEAIMDRTRVLDHDNFESQWHSWSVSGSRKIEQGKRPPLPLGPPFADALRFRGQLADADQELKNLKSQLHIAESAATSLIMEWEKKARSLELEINSLKSSSSWRVTSPIRWAVGKLRRSDG